MSGRGAPSAIVRVREHETKTSEDHPGMSPPAKYELSVGRRSDGYRPLYWRQLKTEYKREWADVRPGDPADYRIKLDMKVGHRTDGGAYTMVDWPDPTDDEGAIRFARRLLEEAPGGSIVIVRASRSSDKSIGPRVYTLAKLERAP